MSATGSTRRIKSPVTKDIVMVVVTGTSDEGVDRARMAGSDLICRKPLTPAALPGHLERPVDCASGEEGVP